MDVEILSKELIRPLSPTPDSLRRLPLSFLDQIVPHIPIPYIYFYSNKSKINHFEASKLLKKSLSEILTTYYPLAGRVNNNSYIACNDEGVLFVEAKVNRQLSDILRDRIPSNNNYFIPPGLDRYPDLVAFSQITFLSCGGIVVSVGISHKIGDGLSWATFFNRWAATARGDPEMVSVPPFGSSTLFPSMDMSRFGANVESPKEKIVTKLFVFDSSAIRSLKEKYTANAGRKISGVLAVSAFLFSRFTVKKQDKGKKYRVVQGMNLRTRMNPPLPMLTFGNYSFPAVVAEGKVEEEDGDWFEAVKKMAESTRNFNATELQNEDGQLNFFKKVCPEEGLVSFVLTSVRGFPLYEADFGWGKPIWIATIAVPASNVVILVPTNDGSGLEAWVNLKDEDMAKFETDHKLLQYVKSGAHSRL